MPVKWIDRVLEVALTRAPQPLEDGDVAVADEGKQKQPPKAAAPGDVVAH